VGEEGGKERNVVPIGNKTTKKKKENMMGKQAEAGPPASCLYQGSSQGEYQYRTKGRSKKGNVRGGGA